MRCYCARSRTSPRRERGCFSTSPEAGRQRNLSLGQVEDTSVHIPHFFFLFKNFFNRERSFGKKRKPSVQSSGRGRTGEQEPSSTAGGCSDAHIVEKFTYLCIRRWTCTRTFRSTLFVVTKIGSNLCVYREMEE